MNIEQLKIDLETSYDFSLKRTFKAIDDIRYGYLTESTLRIFLKKMGHQPVKAEVLAIIRRFDINGDSKISFSEFTQGIKPCYPDFLPNQEHVVKVASKQRLSPGKSINNSPVKEEDPRQFEFRYDRRRRHQARSADKTSA